MAAGRLGLMVAITPPSLPPTPLPPGLEQVVPLPPPGESLTDRKIQNPSQFESESGRFHPEVLVGAASVGKKVPARVSAPIKSQREQGVHLSCRQYSKDVVVNPCRLDHRRSLGVEGRARPAAQDRHQKAG